MKAELLSRFREALSSRRLALQDWLDKAPENHRAERLGPSPREAVEAILDRHDEALDRIRRGQFGCCCVCHGDIEPELLELDFTTGVCLEDMSVEQKRLLEQDLELAAKVQQQLLPQRVPEVAGLELAAHTRPAQIVGGDYFDFFPCRDGALALAVADVMGKGLSASMLMANLQASLRILVPETADLAALAERLNALFRYNLRVIRFISLFLLRVEPGSRRVSYCSAGHNPALRISASGEAAWIKATGPAIGLTSSGTYRSQAFQAAPGDLLLLYTDGLTEASNAGGAEYGTERLAAFASRHRGEPLESLVAGLKEEASAFAGGFQDDVTLVAVRFT